MGVSTYTRDVVGARPAVICAICGRSLLVGERTFRFTPDANLSWLSGGWIGLARSPRASDVGPYTVRAIKLSALWACSHANPTHTATTREEMQQLTQEHHCEGWHQIAGN